MQRKRFHRGAAGLGAKVRVYRRAGVMPSAGPRTIAQHYSNCKPEFSRALLLSFLF